MTQKFTVKETTLKMSRVSEISAALRAFKDMPVLKDNNYLKFKIARNRIYIRDELMALEEYNKTPSGIKDYDSEYAILCRKFCDKDENGKPIVDEKGNFSIVGNLVEFSDEQKVLRKKHKEALDELEENKRCFNELLDSEVTILYIPLPYDDLPEDASTEQIEAIMPIIDGIEVIEPDKK